jgi:hypothetical protein
MSKLIAVLAGGLMLSRAIYAETTTKKPQTVKVPYTATFAQQLDKTNAAILDYASIDCTAPEFTDKVNKVVEESNRFGAILKLMPDEESKELDQSTRLKLAEEGYGVYYFLNLFVQKQNDCVDEHNGSKDLKLQKGAL